MGGVRGFGVGGRDDVDISAPLGTFGNTGGHRQDIDSAGAYVAVAGPEGEDLSHAIGAANPNRHDPTFQTYVSEQQPAAEEAATLTKGSSSAGVSYPGRRKEDDENLVVEQPDGSAVEPGAERSVGAPEGADPAPGEPQTFDWQMSGGGEDRSFRGKGRAWMEDKPGTARALTSNKTLAVHVPEEEPEPQAFESRVARNGRGGPEDVVPPLKAESGRTGKGDSAPMVAFPVTADAGSARSGEAATPSPDAEGRVRLRPPGVGIGEEGDPSFTVSATQPPAVAITPPDDDAGSFELRGREGGAQAEETELPQLRGHTGKDGGGQHAMVFTKTHGAQDADEDPELWAEAAIARPLDSLQHARDVVVEEPEATAFNWTEDDQAPEGRDYSPPVKSGTAGVSQVAVRRAGAAVRRLTPTECERLQGFPDGWTFLPPSTPDGPRYAALGDAVTVNVPRWIVARLRRKWRLVALEGR